MFDTTAVKDAKTTNLKKKHDLKSKNIFSP